MNDVWIIRSTFAGKDEAISIAETLLKEKLVACANIDAAITSLYHWEGSLQQENETVAWFKTTQQKTDHAIARIKELHTYQIPAILSWPTEKGDEKFIAWLKEELR